MRRILAIAVMLVAAQSVSPDSAQAQSYATTVWNQLQSAHDLAVVDGDYSLMNYILGSLDASGTDSWTFTFKGGREYMVIAACDQDCSDVDVTVYDSDGDVVASDVSTDDVPVVTVAPKRDGQYRIEVKMYECSSEPCYWGFGLFAQ